MDAAPPFDEPNELERALMEAAKDPTARGAFSRILLDSRVLVIGRVLRQEGADPAVTAQAGDQVSLYHGTTDDGRECVPFYSSARVLASVAPDASPYLEMRVRDLFTMTRGETLMLNLGAPWGKEFTPREVEQLLDHGWAGDQIVNDRPRQVRLGLPTDEPTALIAGLVTVLKRHPQVARAYLGMIQYKDDPVVPGVTDAHLIIGVEGTGSGDPRAAVQDIGPVAAELAPGRPTDFVVVEEGDEGVAGWLRAEGITIYEKDGA